MAFSIGQFASRIQKGGARPNLFEVKLFNPIIGTADQLAPFFIRTSVLPESTIGTIEVPYFGRKLKIPGDRVFATWTTTIINAEDFRIRDSLERWSSTMASHVTNLRGRSDVRNLKSNAQVSQFSKTGEKLREYEFTGIFPTTISQIDLDWEANDTIETYQVEFAYDYWTLKGGSTRTSSLA